MDPALAPTQAQKMIALPPPPPMRRIGAVTIVGIAALVVGIGVGIGIGAASRPAPPPPAEPSAVGHVGVSSKPVDGNVTVDGRFVGITPVDRLDLDPGKHSIVIDVFGYQPYAGTLEVLPRSQINLRVLLAPLGGSASTSASVSGDGKVITIAIPASALAPGPSTKAAPPEAPRPVRRVEAPPPPRPHRDCDGERYSCRNRCDHAKTDCDFSCFGCSVCTSDLSSDECKRRCDQCRSNCAANAKFCESSCDGQRDSCQASNY
jgi:PEGA domain